MTTLLLLPPKNLLSSPAPSKRPSPSLLPLCTSLSPLSIAPVYIAVYHHDRSHTTFRANKSFAALRNACLIRTHMTSMWEGAEANEG